MDLISSSTPAGSLVILTAEESERYISRLLRLPNSVQDMLFSEATGAFIRGVLKTHNVAVEFSPKVALLVLRIALGEVPLSQLTNLITQQINIPAQTAQKIAHEIERELFGPVMLDLNTYLRQKQGSPAVTAPPIAPKPQTAGGANNVLDLKQAKPQPPLPPPIPR